MLHGILSYVTHFTEVIATVTGIDIEVVDANLLRVAGTGIYAADVGKSIEPASSIYRKSLAMHKPLFIENPREAPLCAHCPERDACRERLTLCAPIQSGNRTLGVIGLVCFNDRDRERILARRSTYVDFVRQIADAIGRVAQSESDAKENRQRLAMLLKVTDQESRGVLVVDARNRIAFLNDAARRELGLESFAPDLEVAITPTGDSYSDMEEYEVRVEGRNGPEVRVVLGRLSRLDAGDPAFDRALVFDSKPNLTAMLSQLGGAAADGALQPIVGGSDVIRTLKARVVQIAATPSTVLITGESGTGKEMFARAIHAASQRRDKPFVAVNCGAIPDALLESELFGYVRGAFTDASPSGRMGKFELADGGALFLDEVGSLPLYLQVKLLRALQERTFTRLGSNQVVRVDIRVIAATNDNLPERIAQRMFREDLYYRLNVIPLEIAPLRERKEDIPALADFFLERYCRLFSKPPARLSAGLLARLMAYDWPGNVREFENCVEYMVNMHERGEMTSAALPAKISRPPDVETRRAASESARRLSAAAYAGAPVVPLAELERDAIDGALAHFGDTAEGKRKAAEALGIGIATLYRKLRR
ncbi:MAG: sigma 54-interacting transcriptional regulator [Planctomycetota bacterium]|jgi:transcriptional regulator with PAS, ATPase and Fis domain|nr:sigma 54-interacting transcriptional regulator [Planctomycetota bacterium]